MRNNIKLLRLNKLTIVKWIMIIVFMLSFFCTPIAFALEVHI